MHYFFSPSVAKEKFQTSAATAEEPDRLPGEIIVNLDKSGKVTVNGKTLGLDDLRDRLARVAKFYPDQAVIIRADKDVRYELLVGVIDTCRAANVWNFSFATNGEAASSPLQKK